MIYNPIFDTKLRFDKALELLNKLMEYKVEHRVEPREGIYVICELNLDTRDLFRNLGADLARLEYCEKDGGIDITELILEIQHHYGHLLGLDDGKIVPVYEHCIDIVEGETKTMKIEDVEPGEKFRIAGQEFLKIDNKLGITTHAIAISDGYHKKYIVLSFMEGTRVECDVNERN